MRIFLCQRKTHLLKKKEKKRKRCTLYDFVKSDSGQVYLLFIVSDVFNDPHKAPSLCTAQRTQIYMAVGQINLWKTREEEEDGGVLGRPY